MKIKINIKKSKFLIIFTHLDAEALSVVLLLVFWLSLVLLLGDSLLTKLCPELLLLLNINCIAASISFCIA